jgi:hypothetical protein
LARLSIDQPLAVVLSRIARLQQQIKELEAKQQGM